MPEQAKEFFFLCVHINPVECSISDRSLELDELDGELLFIHSAVCAAQCYK